MGIFTRTTEAAPAPEQAPVAQPVVITKDLVTQLREMNFDVPALMPERALGDKVTINTALSLSAVYRSVTVLTTIVSQLDLTVLNSVGNPTKVPDIIARPDYTMPLSTFLKQTVSSLAVTGNAYWRLWREDDKSMPSRIEVLDPTRVAIEYDTYNVKTYVYTYPRSKGSVRLQEFQVKHLKLMDLWDSEYGTGPIQRCNEEITHALDLRDYAHRVFKRYPQVMVSIEGTLDPDMRGAYKSDIKTDLETGDGVLVAGNKATLQFLEQDPEKTQYISAQKMADVKIVRAFGLPPNYVLVEDPSNKTYQNMQDVDRNMIRTTVEQYLKEIENSLSDLLPNTRTVKFNTDGWLRALAVNDPAAVTTPNEGGSVDDTPSSNTAAA